MRKFFCTVRELAVRLGTPVGSYAKVESSEIPEEDVAFEARFIAMSRAVGEAHERDARRVRDGICCVHATSA